MVWQWLLKQQSIINMIWNEIEIKYPLSYKSFKDFKKAKENHVRVCIPGQLVFCGLPVEEAISLFDQAGIDILITRYWLSEHEFHYAYTVFHYASQMQHYGSNFKTRIEALWGGIEKALEFLEKNIAS